MKKWHVIVITLFIVVAAGMLMLDRWLHPYDLATEVAAARAAGIPTTPAELKRPKPPPGQDAAPDWLELTRLETTRAHPSRGQVLALIHRATAKPKAYFSHVWTPSELFPYYGVMRKDLPVLSAESLDLAREGRAVEAVRNQALGYRAAHHAGADPLYIGYLVGLALDRITTDGLMDVLAQSGPNPAVTSAIRQALRENPLYNDVDLALQGEVLGMLSASTSIHSVADLMRMTGTPPSGIPALARVRLPEAIQRHVILEPNQAAYMHYVTRFIKATRKPLPARAAAVKAATDDVLRLPEHHPAYVMARLLPVFGPPGKETLPETAARRVLLAATWVMDYRTRHGRWPERLEDAMQQPPLDPFTGKPLRYRQASGGFVVQAAGTPVGVSARPVVFRYPAPAAK